MANEKHLEILKQGVDVWNRWRRENPGVKPWLTGMQLEEMNLERVNFSSADLFGANLRGAILRGAFLGWANLFGAHLTEADLSEADLQGAYLGLAGLRGASLARADLSGSNLNQANLTEADLDEADLRWAYFTQVTLQGANLSEAIMGRTTFGDVDLSAAKGLSAVEHAGPSYVDIHTIYRSRGRIPEVFLRGAGAPASMIEFARSLAEEEKVIDFYSCFIGYSSSDQAFAERLHADLQTKGVRCWFAPEDMKIGDKVRPTLDQSVRAYDKLLIVLSQNSIGSDWVEQEVETALARERHEKRTVLFPIRLDDAVMEIDVGWPALIRNTRHIGDFRNWKNHDAYQQAFGRLLRDLKAEEAET